MTANIAMIPVEVRGYEESTPYRISDVFSEDELSEIRNLIRDNSFAVKKILISLSSEEDPDSDHWRNYDITTDLVIEGQEGDRDNAVRIGHFHCGMYGSMGRNGSWPWISELRAILAYGRGWGGGHGHSLLS